MIIFRSAEDRGHAGYGWLDSRSSFSFGEYYDPQWMGYGPLRVINEDRVVPGAGFSPHSHQDMEIISYVLEGGLKHKDSAGGASVLRHGEIQLMSAGRGITHSEMNASPSEPVHFLQIWVIPDTRGIEAGYQQKALDQEALRKGLAVVAAPRSENAPFAIQQDARLLVAWSAAGQQLDQSLQASRRYYLHLARGRLNVGGRELVAGDALMINGESLLSMAAAEASEVLLFDLPA